MTHETPLPRALVSRRLRIVRPRDAEDIYRQPQAEFARLTRAGLLVKLAHGYYAIPPTDAFGDPEWTPTPESVALGIGTADHGADRSALVGVSVARLRGVLPRAVAVGIVAVPVRRRALETAAGRIVFWSRDVRRLETEAARTDLAWGYATSLEQTLLDVADRPRLGGLGAALASETLWELAKRVDWNRVHALSLEQRRPAAYARALWVCAGIAPTDAPPPKPRRTPTATRGLSSWGKADSSRFGISDDRA